MFTLILFFFSVCLSIAFDALLPSDVHRLTWIKALPFERTLGLKSMNWRWKNLWKASIIIWLKIYSRHQRYTEKWLLFVYWSLSLSSLWKENQVVRNESICIVISMQFLLYAHSIFIYNFWNSLIPFEWFTSIFFCYWFQFFPFFSITFSENFQQFSNFVSSIF